jgi:O-acetylserine/cysteine efflux transporter
MGASAFFLSEPLPAWKMLAAGLVIAGLLVNLFWPTIKGQIRKQFSET